MKSRGMALAVMLAAAACSDDDGTTTGGMDDGNDGGSCTPMPAAEFMAADESGCRAASTDFVPGSDADPFPACATDDGEYRLVDGTPSSVARAEAFDEIVALLAGNPTQDDFTMARTVYAVDEGLESRVLRREDLHYPPIPEADHDPDFEPDKQCSSMANVAKYPDRCAGPAKMAPLITDAFVAGMQGEGNAAAHAARIEAGGLWFLFLSTFKEANTCIDKAKDCDSSWAYYSGGFDRAGGIGMSARVAGLSRLAHDRIFDGILAVRCWRDLYPIEDYPSRADLDATGEALLSDALGQLDAALWYGIARIVRDRVEMQDAACGDAAAANWAFLSVLGPVLMHEALARDSEQAAVLQQLWDADEPSAEDLEAGVEAIDAIFACP